MAYSNLLYANITLNGIIEVTCTVSSSVSSSKCHGNEFVLVLLAFVLNSEPMKNDSWGPFRRVCFYFLFQSNYRLLIDA